MTQNLRQRQAINGARRVLCERDLKPGRDEPTVLRLQPPQEHLELDPSRRSPWPLVAVLAVYVALVLAAVSILPPH